MSTFEEKKLFDIAQAEKAGDEWKVPMLKLSLESYQRGYKECEQDNGLFPKSGI